MKRLILVRHAKSSWKDPQLPDFDRPLNKRGQHDAPMMGKRLAGRQCLPDLMISSPARRAITTAQEIAREIGYPKTRILIESSIYEATVSVLMSVLHDIDNSHDHVMLIGHNPGLTSLSYHLTDYPIDNIPTCGLVDIEFNVERWRDLTPAGGHLCLFDYPKKPEE